MDPRVQSAGDLPQKTKDEELTLQQQEAYSKKLPWDQRRKLTQQFVMEQLFAPARKEGETYVAYKVRRKLAKKAERQVLRGTPIQGM